MANDELMNQVMAAVMKKLEAPAAASAPPAGSRPANTEFVGCNPIGDTIGLVIANVDPQVHALMKIDPSTSPSASSVPVPAPARTSSPPTRPSRPPTPRS